ncbi:MAG: TonB-dependent receptor plug domain-containing protein [Bacteroidota bacterium]|jgi:vitamin B12 transporter
MVRITYFVFFFLLHIGAYGQLGDTLRLPAVEIAADRPFLYSVGNSVSTIDSVIIATSTGNNLGELLAQHSSLFIKTYGPGGSSTLSSRGTEARHTSVFWNGLSISSPTLGLSDLSLMPVSFCDKIVLVRGGSSAINGSSSIGGSVHLLSQSPDFTSKQLYQASIETGSFGTLNGSATAIVGNGLVESRTQLFYGASKNNFKYINRAQRDRPTQELKNSATSGFGLMQDIRFRTGDGQYAGISAWYQTAIREIPPLMTDPSSEAIQRDSSLRLVGNYRVNKEKWGLHLSGGIFFEDQRYDDPEFNIQGHYPVKTVLGEAEWRKILNEKLNISIGGSMSSSSATFKEYGSSSMRRDLLSAFAGAKYQPITRLRIQLNIRQEFLYGDKPILTPQMGMELDLLKSYLTLHASVGRNYHIPSMNDLYWIPGGNPDLEPEDAINMELGMVIRHPAMDHSSLALNTFTTTTDNWIRWQPTSNGIYMPDNLRKVETKGGEAILNHRFELGKFDFRISAEYSYVMSTMVEAYHKHEAPLIGKQLMHIPNHKAAAGISIKKGKSTVVINHAYTGSRFIDSDNNAWLDGFLLADARFEHWFHINRSALGLNIGVFNFWDSKYEIMPFRPTPGRWITAGAKFKFHKYPTL